MKHISFEVDADGFHGAYWPCRGGSACAVIAMLGDDAADYMARSAVKWLMKLGVNVMTMSPGKKDYGHHNYPLERIETAIASVSHMQKLFKRIYGVPIYHYIREYRLEQAAMELVRGTKSVTQIAQDAGYDNASKFSECFKKRYGTTPSQYRLRASMQRKR